MHIWKTPMIALMIFMGAPGFAAEIKKAPPPQPAPHVMAILDGKAYEVKGLIEERHEKFLPFFPRKIWRYDLIGTDAVWETYNKLPNIVKDERPFEVSHPIKNFFFKNGSSIFSGGAFLINWRKH